MGDRKALKNQNSRGAPDGRSNRGTIEETKEGRTIIAWLRWFIWRYGCCCPEPCRRHGTDYKPWPGPWPAVKFSSGQPYSNTMRYLLALLALTTGCSASNAIYVIPGAFTAEEEALIADGADLWNEHVPAHEAINLVFGVTPRNPERILMTGTDLGSPGWTWAERGICMIDTTWLARENAMWLLPAVAAHELAHMEGLHHSGGPSDLMFGVNSARNMQVTGADLTEWRRAH